MLKLQHWIMDSIPKLKRRQSNSTKSRQCRVKNNAGQLCNSIRKSAKASSTRNKHDDYFLSSLHPAEKDYSQHIQKHRIINYSSGCLCYQNKSNNNKINAHLNCKTAEFSQSSSAERLEKPLIRMGNSPVSCDLQENESHIEAAAAVRGSIGKPTRQQRRNMIRTNPWIKPINKLALQNYDDNNNNRHDNQSMLLRLEEKSNCEESKAKLSAIGSNQKSQSMDESMISSGYISQDSGSPQSSVHLPDWQQCGYGKQCGSTDEKLDKAVNCTLEEYDSDYLCELCSIASSELSLKEEQLLQRNGAAAQLSTLDKKLGRLWQQSSNLTLSIESVRKRVQQNQALKHDLKQQLIYIQQLKNAIRSKYDAVL